MPRTDIGINSEAANEARPHSQTRGGLFDRASRRRVVERILCPVDFSETSDAAVRYAVAMATWFGADIRALHVVDVAFPIGSVEVFWEYMRAVREKRMELCSRIRKSLEAADVAGVLTTIDIAEGFAVEQILKHAAASRADLIVMGTRGLGGVRLDSTAEKVLRAAMCPVLTVPPHAERTPPSGRAPFSRILCPVSFSDPSLSALELALPLAEDVNGRVFLVHALEHTPFEQADQRDGDGEARRPFGAERDARDRLRRLIPAEARTWCDPDHAIVVADSPVRAVVRAARDTWADLVVMGVNRRRRIERMLFGSTTQAIVRSATCPVLTVRAS